MIKKQLITLLALTSLCFVGCGESSNTKSYLNPTEDNIELEVELEQNTSSKYPLDILFKLTNLSGKTIYYNDTDVPDKEKFSFNNFNVIEDSKALNYKGPTVVVSSNSFDSLAPGETYTATVSLDKIYTVTKGTHHYQISYMDTIRAKTSDEKTERNNPEDTSPLKPNELGPKDHTSRPINVKSNILEFEANIKKIRELY